MQDVPQRVEHGAAGGAAAQNRFVLDGRQVGSLLQGGEQRRHRHHHPGRLKPAGRPDVPAEARAVTLLVLGNVLWEGRHGNARSRRLDALWGRGIIQGAANIEDSHCGTVIYDTVLVTTLQYSVPFCVSVRTNKLFVSPVFALICNKIKRVR